MSDLVLSKNRTIHWLILIAAVLFGIVLFFAYHLHAY